MSKVMGIYVKFTKTTHQIWACHVTLTSNSEKFYFSPNSVLNFRKSYQIWGELAKEQKKYRQKTNWGVENTPPPGAYRVKKLSGSNPLFGFLTHARAADACTELIELTFNSTFFFFSI